MTGCAVNADSGAPKPPGFVILQGDGAAKLSDRMILSDGFAMIPDGNSPRPEGFILPPAAFRAPTVDPPTPVANRPAAMVGRRAGMAEEEGAA